MARYEEQRNFLNFKTFSAIETDKQKGIPKPPNVKSYHADAQIVDLPAVDGGVVKKENIYEMIKERRVSPLCERCAQKMNFPTYCGARRPSPVLSITFRTVP